MIDRFDHAAIESLIVEREASTGRKRGTVLVDALGHVRNGMPHPERFVLADDAEVAGRRARLLFDSVRARIAPILPVSAEVLHVGATAIPGCLTKGDLDIVVRVEPADFTAVETSLATLFGRNAGSIRTGDFAAFEDAGCRPHVGIQLTAMRGAFDVFHRFTDALRADPELVRRYNALKRAHHNRSMACYRADKDAFVAEVLRMMDQQAPVRSGP